MSLLKGVSAAGQGFMSRRYPATVSGSTRGHVVAHAEIPALKKPELRRPDVGQVAKKLFEEEATAAPVAAPAGPSSTPAPAGASKVVTIEYQRQRAKEMNKYFKEVQLTKVTTDAKVFGWTPKNEIANGRWVMFGWLVGMLTEYGTGVDFVDQIKLMLTYLGIADLD